VAEKVAFIPISKKLSIAEMLSSINLEKDYATRVTRTYYLAQDLVKEKLDLPPETNETHREYCERVSKTAPFLTEPLREVAELFELASYTATPIDAAQCGVATGALTRLFQELESAKERA
jgi:hypothetical protein